MNLRGTSKLTAVKAKIDGFSQASDLETGKKQNFFSSKSDGLLENPKNSARKNVNLEGRGGSEKQ